MRGVDRVFRAGVYGGLSLLVLGGCGRSPIDGADELPGGGGFGVGCVAGDCGASVTLERAADILFVIDNSGSMGEEQGTLASNFSSFIEVLEGENVGASYRVGVTTTDLSGLRATSCLSRLGEFTWRGSVGAAGVDYELHQQFEGCQRICEVGDLDIQPTATDAQSTPRARPWLEKTSGETNVGAGISITDALECAGPQGISGDGFEAPLESMLQVLENDAEGFVRDDALLAVIFVTDEADCSMPRENWQAFRSYEPFTTPLWTFPDRPSSATCWQAGVECEGGPGLYDTCRSQDKDWNGQPTTPDNAVLYSVERYVELLRRVSNEKEARGGNGTVLVAVIAGVPEDYPQGGQLIYQDSADQDFNLEYGIGPGCGRGTESISAPPGIPPVRLREFAEAFETEGRNIFSICNDDYAVALEQIAVAISELGSRACVPGCVADVDDNVGGIQPNCIVVEARSTADGGAREVEPCLVTNTAWYFPDGAEVCYRELSDATGQTTTPEHDNMSQQCITRGSNLEIVLERREGVPVAPGAAVQVDCERVEPAPSGECRPS